MGNLNPKTSSTQVIRPNGSTAEQSIKALETIAVINLELHNSADCTVNYAKLYVNEKLRRCEVLCDLYYNEGMHGGTHYYILNIPPKYLPKEELVYGSGTAGVAGYLQFVVNSDTGAIDIWCMNDFRTVRGNAFWYY